MNNLLEAWLESTDDYYIDYYSSLDEFASKLSEYSENSDLDGTQFEQYCENDLDLVIGGINL